MTDLDIAEAMTPKQATEYAGVSRSTLYRWQEMGLLTIRHTASGHARVLRTELDTILKNLPKRGAPKGGWPK